MSEMPTSEPAEPKRLLPRWVFLLAVPGFLGPLFILAFIFKTELAHDEVRCPYEQVSERALSPRIVVREERRSCVRDVEERRYSAIRADAPAGERTRVLGRRRLPSEAFLGPSYSWQAQVSDKGEVQLEVACPGHPKAVFREGTPEEHADQERASRARTGH
jgi:hypothetical protein